MSTPAIYQRQRKGIKALDVLTRFPKLGCLQLSVSQAACFNHFHPKVSAVNSKSRKGRMGFGSGEVSWGIFGMAAPASSKTIQKVGCPNSLAWPFQQEKRWTTMAWIGVPNFETISSHRLLLTCRTPQESACLGTRLPDAERDWMWFWWFKIYLFYSQPVFFWETQCRPGSMGQAKLGFLLMAVLLAAGMPRAALRLELKQIHHENDIVCDKPVG